LKGGFHKISRVGTFVGDTKWYLSEDCLLAAVRSMYAVEYRRFYLRDLESITIWPTRVWLWHMSIRPLLLAALAVAGWRWANITTAAICGSAALASVVLELVLGPTAGSRIRTAGASIDLPLAPRTRRAQKVLAEIEAAVRSTRGMAQQSAAPTTIGTPAEHFVPASSEALANPSLAAATKTNGA
jgi:hypothetical protein